MKINITHKIHLIKAITWRILGTIDTILLTWIITGNLKISLSVGGFELFSKILLYYIHERIWYKILNSFKKN